MTPRDRVLVHFTADLVILTIRGGALHVLLVERANEPFAGLLALPGGFLRGAETVRQAAERELREETGVDPATLHLEQVGVYSAPDRDPRPRRVITCAFLAIAPDLPVPTAGSDARSARWTPVDDLLGGATRLAFDHDQVLADAVEQAREKLRFSTVATVFCEPEFTISDLREVYEAVWGVELDRPNFHRKVTDADGFIIPTDGKRAVPTGRPARLYRAGPADVLDPPMARTARTRPRF
ncbi:NUDIX domain-containing protein [Actinokineospora auranticolor]|uniref:8-oxo-dGTP diphosphatase n=1 Tax=Actinokineospora auranticolor TaxID=155976 RepID=A0A2S6GBF4_9PSEU|nr:NUDIX domain-containing protein [Actinokineospora auranticolor]PPK61003.1 8-oxo-dGTP diphosphatase [Actinokineospora auranticolor]